MTFKEQTVATGTFLAFVSLVLARAAGADPLVFQFGGVIDFVEQGLPISDQIATGVPYTAVYQFDPEGVVDVNDSPWTGSYPFGTSGAMFVELGDITIASIDLRASIENSPVLDRYAIVSMTPFVAHSTLWQAMALDLRDATHSAFNSDALPLTAPNLANFQLSQLFYLIQPNRREPSITGTVEFLTMIPEPSSVGFLVSGSALLALRRRRQGARGRVRLSAPSVSLSGAAP